MTRKKNFWINEKNLLPFILLLAVLLLFFSSFIRSVQEKPIMIGEAYYDLRISKEIFNKGLLKFDDLQNRQYDFNLYHYLLAGVGYFVSEKTLVLVIPFLLGIISLVLFWLILKKFGLDTNVLFFSLFIFVLSPIFLFLFTNLSKYSFAVFLSLTAFLIFMFRKSYYSALPLIILSLIDFSSFIIVLLILLIYAFLKEKIHPWIFSTILSIISIILSIFILNYSISFDFLIKKPIFAEVLTSFGALIGLSIFTLFLAVLGFATLWKKKKAYLFFNITFIILLFISFFSDPAKIAFNFFVSGLAGHAFFLLLSREWAIITIKKFTILLILCSLIFSTSVYISEAVASEPSKELADAIIFLKDYESFSIFEEDLVFTHSSYGFFVEYFADKKSFLDPYSFMQENYETLNNISTEIFYSRNLDNTEIIMQNNDIRYFLVTPAMKNGLVWEKPDEGLLFLFENSNKIVKIYDNQGIEIWLYSGFVE